MRRTWAAIGVLVAFCALVASPTAARADTSRGAPPPPPAPLVASGPASTAAHADAVSKVVGGDAVSAITYSLCGKVFVVVQPLAPTSASFISHLPMTVFISEPTRGFARQQMTIFNPGSPTLVTGEASYAMFTSTPEGRGPGAVVELSWSGGGTTIQTDPYVDNCYGDFVPTLPTRLLDTRAGTGRSTAGKVAPGIVALDVSGPIDRRSEGVTAVILNVTATNPESAGYVTVFPCGDTLATTSNLNFAAGETVANLVVVDLVGRQPIGKVCLYTSTTTDLLADLTGYYLDDDPTIAGSPAALFKALTLPQRLLDTRASTTVAGGTTIRVPTSGRAGIPATGINALSMNITATQPATSGYLTVYPCDTQLPDASNVNFVAGQTRPNAAIVGTGASGEICVFASTTTHILVDVVGYFGALADGVAYWPHIPIRRWDSRTVLSGGETTPRRLAAGTSFTYSTPYLAGDVLNLNVTVTDPTANGYVSVYPCAQGVPGSSNLNFTAGQTAANTVQVLVDQNRRICLYTSVPIFFILDQSGTYFTPRS